MAKGVGSGVWSRLGITSIQFAAVLLLAIGLVLSLVLVSQKQRVSSQAACTVCTNNGGYSCSGGKSYYCKDRCRIQIKDCYGVDQACIGGKCVKVCDYGDTRCSKNSDGLGIVQVCGSTHNWKTTNTCTPPLVCRPGGYGGVGGAHCGY